MASAARLRLSRTEPSKVSSGDCQRLRGVAAVRRSRQGRDSVVLAAFKEQAYRGIGGGARAAPESSAESSGTEKRSREATKGSGLRDAGSEGQVPEYTMTPVDHVLLRLFRMAVVKELGGKDREEPGFKGVGKLVRRLHTTSKGAEETQARGTRVLKTLVPPAVSKGFGAFLRLFPGWFGARHAAASTVVALNWLVGPAEINDAPDNLLPDDKKAVPPNTAAAMLGTDPESAGYKQGVLVKRCRVLEETKCASVCLNVCQVPTQRFFTEDIGLPMTMVPNFDTFECQFVFGRLPPPPEESDIFTTPCFKQCPSAIQRATQCDVQQYQPFSQEEASEFLDDSN